MMDRRELLYRASMLLGGTLSAGAISGVLSGCVAAPETGAPKGGFLSAKESATVTAMSAQIIPLTDTPGAVEVGVPGFIDTMLTSFYQDRERNVMRAGLATVSADATKLGAVSFAALPVDQQIVLMKRYDQEQYDHVRARSAAQNSPPHFFRLMKELTIIGFCTSEAGATKLMNYVQTPGPYRGDLPLSAVGKASAL